MRGIEYAMGHASVFFPAFLSDGACRSPPLSPTAKSLLQSLVFYSDKGIPVVLFFGNKIKQATPIGRGDLVCVGCQWRPILFF